MFRCEFAICTIRLDRIRTRRYFSVSSMSVDEVCSNKSLLQFFKDTVTKEMTGSRSSIIYPHHPFLPIPYSSARHTSHPNMLTYIHVTFTPPVAWQSLVQAPHCHFPMYPCYIWVSAALSQRCFVNKLAWQHDGKWEKAAKRQAQCMKTET